MCYINCILYTFVFHHWKSLHGVNLTRFFFAGRVYTKKGNNCGGAYVMTPNFYSKVKENVNKLVGVENYADATCQKLHFFSNYEKGCKNL